MPVIIRMVVADNIVQAPAREDDAVLAIAEGAIVLDKKIVAEIVRIETVDQVVGKDIIPPDHVFGLGRIGTEIITFEAAVLDCPPAFLSGKTLPGNSGGTAETKSQIEEFGVADVHDATF